MSAENHGRTWVSAGPGTLLQLIRTAPRWTKSDLVRESGLARTTLIERLDLLQEAGYVHSNKRPVQTGGRPAETYSFNPAGGYLLVADIGGSHTRLGVTDMAGSLIASAEADLYTDDGPQSVLSYVVDRLDQLRTEFDIDPGRIRAIGVGVPGPVLNGMLSRPQLPGWEGTSVSEFFAPTFPGIPVVVDQDANIMARGEQSRDPERFADMVVLKVGMGIGCAIVVDGRVLQGADGAAGGIGHIPRGGDLLCPCGQYGCLETVASGRAIARALNQGGHTVKNSRDIVNLVRRRDVQATNLVRQAGRELGGMLGLVSAIANPSVIIVGGNLAESPEPLLAGIRETIYADFSPALTSDLEITASTLGIAAGLAGAAQLALDALLLPRSVDHAILQGQSWLS